MSTSRFLQPTGLSAGHGFGLFITRFLGCINRVDMKILTVLRLREMRGRFTRACEVSGDNEEIDDPTRRRDRCELRRHHEATDGAHPTAVLKLFRLHLEVATDDERQCLGSDPLAYRAEDLPVFLGEPHCACKVKESAPPPGTMPQW